jgi:hypothetical protein
MALFVGLRYEVGVDWVSYLRIFKFAGQATVWQMTERADVAYVGLNWLVQQASWPFWAVNLVCAGIFCWGLYRFVRWQPEPWLATLVAIPYLVVVVAMGYTRQGAAIGILLAGLSELIRGKPFWRYIAYVIIATLFHSSAAFALPLAALGSRQGRWSQIILVPAAIYGLYSFRLEGAFDRYRIYLNPSLQSQGAAIRIVLCVIPAVIYFIFRKRLQFSPPEAIIWRNFSLASFLLLGLLFVLPSSTPVDRIGLYVVPLQLAVLSRASLLTKDRVSGRAGVIAYSGVLLVGWLNFSQFAASWIPYRSYLSS